MSFSKYPLRSLSQGSRAKVGSNGFLGIDASEGGSRGGCLRAADTVNMMRSAVGQVTKRPGFRRVQKPDWLTGIDGVYHYKHSDKDEKYFFIDQKEMYVAYPSYNLEKHIKLPSTYTNCVGFQAGDFMIFISPYSAFFYNCEKETQAEYLYAKGSSILEPDMVYLPTTFIACLPSGEGSAYQPVNILNPFVAEQYIGDGQSREFTLHFPVKSVYGAYTKDLNGAWQQTEVESFTQNSVTLKQAPNSPELSGEDNVRIVYKRPDDSYKFTRIVGSGCAAVFGVGGFEDRVFVSGNGHCPGYVYYSEINQPDYFPETNYIKVGNSATRVCALEGIGTKLYIICNDNIYCVEGKAVEDNEYTDYVENSVFSVTDILKSPVAINHPAVIFDGEVNYLTKAGVCAITPNGVLDERCCQIRSANIGALIAKEQLEDAVMIPFGNYLIISNRKDTLYVLDGIQFDSSETMPFSKRQYECYVWKGIDAKYLWLHGESLYFSDGNEIYSFAKNFETDGVYADVTLAEDGSEQLIPVSALWETADIFAGDFERDKFFMHLGLLMGTKYREDDTAFNSDVKISARFDGERWRVIKDYGAELRVFDYGDIDYGRFTYRNRRKSFGIFKRTLHKKGKSIRLRFENCNMNESFILNGFAVEYKIIKE